MNTATVTRYFFYIISTLFLIAPVIKSLNPIDHHDFQLSTLKRNSRDGSNDHSVQHSTSSSTSGISSSENMSNENTNRAVVDVDVSDEDNRRVAAASSKKILDMKIRPVTHLSQGDYSIETLRAASATKDDSEESTWLSRANTNNNSNQTTRRAKYSENETAKRKEHFWKKIMNNAIKSAIEPLKASSEVEVRKAVVDVGSVEDNSNEGGERVSVASDESGNEQTRRYATSSEHEDSDEKMSVITFISDENNDVETRRLGEFSIEKYVDENIQEVELKDSVDEKIKRKLDSTEDMIGDEMETKKNFMDLKDISSEKPRRFSQNLNVNQNVNTNINSNVRTNPMGFLHTSRYRQHHRRRVALQRHIPENILERLKLCDIFRNNIIFAMGSLLQNPNDQLSLHEYLSLEMIYNAIKSKTIYMYNLLSILPTLRGKTPAKQFFIVLKALERNMPLYIKSAAAYWIQQIKNQKINLDFFLMEGSDSNILTNIPNHSISNNGRRGMVNAIVAYDDESKITAKLLGPIYVPIFQKVIKMKNFSQSLFGQIIRDLPNTNNDPVFEEYTTYIAEEAFSDKIPNWYNHLRNVDAKNPYTFVINLSNDICMDDMVSLQMKRALVYIRHYITNSGRRTVVNDLSTITENGLNIELLLNVVEPLHSDNIYHLKSRLRAYLLLSPGPDIASILADINKFKYNTPKDLILAMLARLQMRLSPNNEVQIVASALLSNLLFPTTIRDVLPPVNSAIAFWIIIDSIIEPDVDVRIKSLVKSLQMSLIKNLKEWDKIQTELVPRRTECDDPQKCVLIILEKLKSVLENKPSFLSVDIMNTINDLIAYVIMNLEEKISLHTCHETPAPVTISSLFNEYWQPQKAQNRLKTSERPPTRNKLLKYEIQPTFSTTQSSRKVLSKLPKIAFIPRKLKSKSKKKIRPVKKLSSGISKKGSNLKKKLYKKQTTTESFENTSKPRHMTFETFKKPAELETNLKPLETTSNLIELPLNSAEHQLESSKIFQPKKTSRKLSEIDYESLSVGSMSSRSTDIPLQIKSKPLQATSKLSNSFIQPYKNTRPKLLLSTPRISKMTTKLPKSSLQPSTITDSPTKQMSNTLKSVIEPIESTDKISKSTVNERSSNSNVAVELTESISQPKKLESQPLLLKVTKSENAIMKVSQSNTTKLRMPRGNRSFKDLSIVEKHKLPPNMTAQGCIIFDNKFNKAVLPSIYTQSRPFELPQTAIIFPSMAELHADISDDYEIITDVNQACGQQLITEIIDKINRTMNGSYEVKLLGKDWQHKYPTKISALISMMEVALRQPEVRANTKLRKFIVNYRDGLKYIGPYIFLPMLSRWKNLDEEIIWSSIDMNDHDFTIIANAPPKEIEADIITLPLINPSHWLLPINEEDNDPLPDLLPRLPFNSTYANILKPLVDIFSLNGTTLSIGHSIDLSEFPNRGALLMYTLTQLKNSNVIRKNGTILKLIKMYLNILQKPALYIKIPQDVITGEQNNGAAGWRVDTVDLMELLPKPTSPADTTLYETMRIFLSQPNLLSDLEIPIPPMETTKGAFMKLIIHKSLKSKNINNNNMLKTALNYYQDKFDIKYRGRMNLGWIWTQKFIVSTEMHLGELIEKLLPYTELSKADQKAYDDLVVYFTEHPHLLNAISLPLTEYKTRGEFVRGFFEHLLKKNMLDEKIKENVEKLLPRVKMTGEGAKGMPPLARKAMSDIEPI